MRTRNAGILAVLLSLVGISAGVVFADDNPSPWVSSAEPNLTEVLPLPDNIPPSSENIDCQKITVRYTATSTMQEQCVMQVPLGLASTNTIVFAGTDESIAVVPPHPNIGLRPIPGQPMFYTLSSAPVTGLHIHFYRSIRDKMKPVPDLVNGRLQYNLTAGPDFTLKDPNGKPYSINSSAMTFSANGNWMVAEVNHQGFIRVNMATFEVTPFAQPMAGPSEYTTYPAQVTISNDGRYVALRPREWQQFNVYDVNSCQGAVLPVVASQPKCLSRDYWPYLNSRLQGLRSLYQPRFTSENQLSVKVLYQYVGSGNFKVGQYMLTAPGVSPTGIEYLGLGDSFAAGQGAFNYITGTDTENNTCHLSSRSYPFLLSAGLFSEGRSVACSGAKMRDIKDMSDKYEGQVRDGIFKEDRNNIDTILASYMPGYLPQKEFVDKHNPQSLTLSIGGNDIGFATIVTDCVMPKLKNNTCLSTYEEQKEVADRIRSKEKELKETYRLISGPGRRVYILGYPHIVAAGGKCQSNVHLNQHEVQAFIDLTDTLNQVIKRAAEGVGAHYIDVGDAFMGHRLCEGNSAEAAVNGVTAGNDNGYKNIKFIGNESFHPNELGHELLRKAILQKTNNFKLGALPPVTAPSPTAIIPSALPYVSAPKTGRPVYTTVVEGRIAPDVTQKTEAFEITVDASMAVLPPSSTYRIHVGDSTSPPLAEAITDAEGNLKAVVQIPEDIPCGYNTLNVYGKNMVNQPLNVFKTLFIAASDQDCDDNGVPDTDQPCGFMPESGRDVDQDGTDDACDALIGEPPSYKVYLTGSSIHITRNPASGTVEATFQTTATSE